MSANLAIEKAEIAITKSLMATSAKFQPTNKDNAININQTETTSPPILGITKTKIPAAISITPTIIIKVAPENGSRSNIVGFMYWVQSHKILKNLSSPATIGTMVKVNFKRLKIGVTLGFNAVESILFYLINN